MANFGVIIRETMGLLMSFQVFHPSFDPSPRGTQETRKKPIFRGTSNTAASEQQDALAPAKSKKEAQLGMSPANSGDRTAGLVMWKSLSVVIFQWSFCRLFKWRLLPRIVAGSSQVVAEGCLGTRWPLCAVSGE